MPFLRLPAVFRLVLGLVVSPHVIAQDFVGSEGQESFAGIDLLFPEFAHPKDDVAESIKKRDFRFITLDLAHDDVPGIEDRPRLKKTYGVKIIRQHLRLFQNRSQKFSFKLRARAYAHDYNQTLLHHLLTQRPKQ